MSDLSRQRITAVDSEGMIDHVLSQPEQLEDALWRVESAGLQHRDLAGGLVVCAMGGSAIGADLAATVMGPAAVRPIRTVRNYSLPSWIRAETLVLCASYSGETEEVLACYAQAGDQGAPRVVVTTGGRLAELARADGVPVIGVPSGMQPRASFIYVMSATLACAAASHAAPAMWDAFDGAARILATLTREWGPDAPPDSTAKALARSLVNTVPVIHGAELTAPVALRWKSQLNENPEMIALWSELPEANHNESVAWPGSGNKGLSAVFLEDPSLHPRVAKRMEITARLAADAGADPVARLSGRGENRLERLLSLVLLGDLASVYLAVLTGVDPTPIAPVDWLKKQLGD